MNESPEKFKWYKDHPMPPTDSLIFGQYVHALLLEPEKAETDFYVLPKLNLRTKADNELFKQIRSECEETGRTIVPFDDAETARQMVEKCNADPDVMELLNGAHEQEFFWTDEMTGEKCKCRVDCLTEVDGEITIVDYKSTANAATHAFVRDIYKHGYHFQTGMYGAGVQACLGLDKLPRFVFIAQEKKPPYSINRIEATEDVIQLGYDKFREFIGIYHECKVTDCWYGYNGVTGLSNEAYLLEWVRNGDDE